MLNNFKPKIEYKYYKEGLLSPDYTVAWADQYAQTMGQALYTNGLHDTPATFHLYMRDMPFGGSYMMTGGQNIAFEWLDKNWRLDEVDEYLMRTKMIENPLTGGLERLYTDKFINFSAKDPLRLTIDAMPEGELAFRDEPIMRVHGPLRQCLVVEAAFLNSIYSQSMYATLASHFAELAGGAPILEFGLRRNPSIGGLEASRGVYLGGGNSITGGGVIGTSNNLAEKMYGIPSNGTMAHAFIMTYESELKAFADYAKAMPYNGVFLVDTYDTIEGVKRAIDTCKTYGIKLKGIRLDSGDMLGLSRETRKILDAAGFNDTKIIASDGLSYKKITELKAEGAPIDVYAIGSSLVNLPATVSPVYKLAAIFGDAITQGQIDALRTAVRAGGAMPSDPAFMREVIKLSNETAKISFPGEQDVVRYLKDLGNGKMRFDGDTIVPLWNQSAMGPANDNGISRLVRPIISAEKGDDTNHREFPVGTLAYSPLRRTFNEGSRIIPLETVHVGRARGQHRLGMLEQSHKGMPARYPYRTGVEAQYLEKRRNMITTVRQKNKALAA
jgi:nicotinate phosphoribosyltransferase